MLIVDNKQKKLFAHAPSFTLKSHMKLPVIIASEKKRFNAFSMGQAIPFHCESFFVQALMSLPQEFFSPLLTLISNRIYELIIFETTAVKSSNFTTSAFSKTK